MAQLGLVRGNQLKLGDRSAGGSCYKNTIKQWSENRQESNSLAWWDRTVALNAAACDCALKGSITARYSCLLAKRKVMHSLCVVRVKCSQF